MSHKYLITAWLICGLGATFYTYEYFLRISPSLMENSIRARFNLSATGFGALSSLYYYAYVPMQLPVGVLMDRYGPRLLLTIACLICVIGTFMFGASPSILVAGTGRFLVGLGSAFAFVGVLKLATIWLPEDKMAFVSGLTAALGTIGAILGDNILGVLVVKIGWQETIMLTAIVGGFLTIGLWIGIKDKKSYKRKNDPRLSFKRNFLDLAIIIKNKQIWLTGLFGCLVYLPTTVFAELWGIPYLKAAVGMTPAAASFANSLLFLGFTVGAPFMGYISDKIKRRKLPMTIGAIGASILVAMLLYMPGMNDLAIDITLFLLGICYSVQCLVFVVGRELSPKNAAGTAMALINMLVMLGALVLQPLVGLLLDFSFSTHMSKVDIDAHAVSNLQKLYTGYDFELALTVIPLGILAAAILTYFIRETHASAPRT